MKTLPIEQLPSTRVRMMTDQAARHNKLARAARVQAAYGETGTPPPPHDDGMLAAGIAFAAVIFVLGAVAGCALTRFLQ